MTDENASIIPDGIIPAAEVECLLVERDSLRLEVERLNRHVASQSELLQDNADVYNATRRAHDANRDLLTAMTAERDSARTAHSQMSAAYDKAVKARQETETERDAISDALHRAGVGDAPQLVDRIALAGEELHKLRLEVTAMRRGYDDLHGMIAGDGDIWTKVNGLLHRMAADKTRSMAIESAAILERDKVTAERDSLRQQLEAKASELAFTDRSLTSTKQQLEAAQVDRETYCQGLADMLARVGPAERDLAAAQQRIAALEAELASARDDRGRLLGERVMFAAALRAIAPVYWAAASEVDDWRGGCGLSGERVPTSILMTVTTARAALTPELLAVIEAATK